MRSADNKILVVGFRTGRLANRLVLFANVIGFAAEHGYRVVNVAFHSYAHLFENTRRDIYCRYPIARHRSLFDVIPGAAPAIRKTRIFYQFIRRASEWNDRFPILGKSVFTLREIPRQTILLDTAEVQARMAGAKIVFVHGWAIRAPESVKRHAEKIRDYFRPVAALEDASRRVVGQLRQVAEVIIGEYGPDIIIPAGGGMLGHPDGYTAGAQSWQQAIAAVMAEVPLPEAARKPENRALRRALEKWGYMERPTTPWLRLAPDYQPKAMKFD